MEKPEPVFTTIRMIKNKLGLKSTFICSYVTKLPKQTEHKCYVTPEGCVFTRITLVSPTN